MSLPIGPPGPPTPSVAQFLAEAALQRQTQLLGQGKEVAPPPAASGPQSPAVPPPPPLPAGAAPVPAPGSAERVSISEQARQQTQPLAGETASKRTLVPSSPSTLSAGAGAARSAPAVAPGPGAPPASAARAASAASAWPSQGVAPAVQQLAQRVVSSLVAGGVPPRVLAVQEWPTTLARAVMAAAPPEEGPAEDAALVVWRVNQGVVQTPDGARGMTTTLRVPAAALAALENAARQVHMAEPARGVSPLAVPFEGRAASLQSGAFALVLQTPPTPGGAPALRMSALLEVDLQPWATAAPQAMVYAREQLQPRLDPWLQMAALQASGQLPRDEERAAAATAPLCATPGCPYAGRAACEQPFCAVLRQVVAVVPPAPVGPEGV